MNGPSNQLLACARFSIDQHRGIGGSDAFDELQDSLQRRALSDDLGEIHFGANFIFEIELFLRKLVFQALNLAVRQCILNRESNLVSNLLQKMDLVLGEGVITQPA